MSTALCQEFPEYKKVLDGTYEQEAEEERKRKEQVWLDTTIQVSSIFKSKAHVIDSTSSHSSRHQYPSFCSCLEEKQEEELSAPGRGFGQSLVCGSDHLRSQVAAICGITFCSMRHWKKVH